MTGWARPVGVLLLLAGLSWDAMAHKLKVFAFAEGNRILGSTYFAGGVIASGARIEVRDTGGSLLAELVPDREGTFVYVAQAPIDHLILAITGDGHRAEWRVTADELFADLAAVQEPEASGVAQSHARDQAIHDDRAETEMIASTSRPAQTLDPELEAAIERAVARQVRPLREQLIAAEDRIRIQDILGGLGYILGLTGLAFWWRSRHRPAE
jgi:nickel transport protein